MLQSLQWYVQPPTPLAYCREFMNLVSNKISPVARHGINELARFLTELSVTDYWFVTKKRSCIALASLIYAMELQLRGGGGGSGSGCTGAAEGGHGQQQQCTISTINNRHTMDFLSRVAEHFTNDDDDDEIVECFERLAEIYRSGGYSPGHLEDDEDNNNNDGDDEEEEEMGLEEEEDDDEAEEDDDEEGGARMATISPTGVADGPDALFDVQNRSVTAGVERKRKYPG
jgi:hypothetical protein